MLGIAIDLIKILCRAYERQKDLARLLDSHLTELTSLRDVIHIVEEEGALQTTNVAATLARLKASEKKLIAWLKRVDPGSKSSMQQFSRQLAYGSKDQKLLTEIMNEISRAKTDLCMDINVAHVGVTRTVESGVVANSKAVRRIERRPARFSSKERELNTARPLEDRSTHGEFAASVSVGGCADIVQLITQYCGAKPRSCPVPPMAQGLLIQTARRSTQSGLSLATLPKATLS